MKKIIFLLLTLFPMSSVFSQNYIGKSFGQIIIGELYTISSDSTEVWERKNVYVDLKDSKEEKKITIHDLDNFRVIACTINNDTCTSFTIVFYSLSKDYVEKLLDKKYNYNGNETWNYCFGDLNLQFSFEEMPGRIFKVEAYSITTKQNTQQAIPITSIYN